MATPPSSADHTTATTTVTTTATSTTSEGPVLTVLTKRIRALRKKLNRIIQMEQSVSQGKQLNQEQLEVLRSKPALLTLIDELEKLRAPISSAIEEEISLATTISHADVAMAGAGNLGDDNSDNAAEDLVKLMYFGSLFDVKQQSEFTSLMLTKTHERECCLTYDCVTDDAVDVDLLGEKDLDLISELLGLMIAKPVNSTLTHRSAVEKCLEHAKLWIQKSDQPVHPQSDVTYAMLREKLNKIMSSEYFTTIPQMKGPTEVAAAVANFGSFQVPIHESMVNVQVPIQVEGSLEQYQVEGSAEQYQETENAASYEVQSHQENASSYEVPSHQENAATYEEPEITERHQSVNSEEFHKDEKEVENPPPEIVSVQTDQEQYQNDEGEHGYQNVNYYKDQQYAPRGGRRGGGRGGGGGRRGYFNGRGGGRGTGRGNGPYQNGRGQYHDNSYQRNYYNRRGRGGAGGGGGGGGNSNGNGGGYFNNSSGAEGNHPRGDIGVAS